MLKFVIIGLVFATVSSAPLDSKILENPADSHPHIELIRPSPINPDIPMDPKPPERIILDDGTERDNKSISEETPTIDNKPHENLKMESRDSEPSDENNQEKNVEDENVLAKSGDVKSDDKSVKIEYSHDDVRDGVAPLINIKTKELIHPIRSDEPIIVYAVKVDEKQQPISFQTSHRIPNVEETERKFETSHHIPTHIDSERTKLIETSKVGEKAQD